MDALRQKSVRVSWKGLLIDGCGRGWTRSDRRAFVCYGRGFWSTGAAEDGRAPTEERSCVMEGASDRRGRPGTAALRQKSFRVCA